MKSRLLLVASVAALLTACATPASEPPAQIAGPASDPGPLPEMGGFGVDLAGMDPSVKPGDSFFRHVNGRWLETTEIPADRASYNSFTRLTVKAAAQTREIIEDVAKNPTTDEERKIAAYFNSFMDEAAIEAKGAEPLKPGLAAIAAIDDRVELARALGGSIRADVDILNATDPYTDRPFGLWVAQDMKNPDTYAPYIIQGGLGMPDREYYLSDEARYVELRKQYEGHVATMLRLAGFDRPEERARGVMALEMAIARSHASALDSSDVEKGNNPWSRADFDSKAPGIDWNAFFDAAGLSNQHHFIVWQPSAVTGMSRLAKEHALAAWKDYLAYHHIDRSAPYLSEAFVDEYFAFNNKALSGTPQLAERWKRGVDFVSSQMGEPIGKLYVARHFSPEAKAEVENMVRNILAAFGRRLDANQWLGEATKARAKAKLATMTYGIGYPDNWRDYSGLQVVQGDALGNAERTAAFDYAYALGKLGRPVDRKEWFMTPQLVNALNVPQTGGIFFPAAILQPPFFDLAADPAVNYGAIGAVIGHEITHSFDDTGALFDERGALANWWTAEDLARFKAAGAELAAQYSAYEPLPGLNLNGEQTLGENIADVAGLNIAYEGWRASLGGAEPPVIDGFTGDQRFFLGFGQVWRAKFREAALRRAVITGVHSPGEFRASTVRNLDPWYPAFDVQPGQALYLAPEDRVQVW